MKLRVLLIVIGITISNFLQAQNQSFSFVENNGQWEDFILFESDIPSGRMYLLETGITYKLTDMHQMHEFYAHGGQGVINEHAIMVNFLNASFKSVEKEQPKTEYFNYFIGNDPAGWQSNVKAYLSCKYTEIYKGIDLKYTSNGNGIKYDFIVQPEADPSQIEIEINGANNLTIDEKGRLKIGTTIYDIVENAPFCYQELNGQKVEVSSRFVLDGNVLRFELGDYDKSKELVIDPDLVFSTYSNTSDSGAIVSADAATYDLNDNLLVAAGSLKTGYPPTAGAYQTNPSGNNNGFSTSIAKFDPTSGNLMFATYLAGDNNNVSYPLSLTVDENDNVYVLGHTNQNDFPTVGGYQNNLSSGYDYYISKLNGTGTSLIASTFLGGQGDEVGLENNFPSGFPSGILVHNNEVYIAGTSSSSDFPTTNGVIQETKGFGFDNDAVAAKLSGDLSNLVWGTYIGSSNGDDVLSDVKVMSDNSVILCGYTSGGLTGMNGVNTNSAGNKEGFVVRINSTATAVLAGTYLGTGDDDNARFVHVDNEDDVYIFGASNGTYPTAGGAYADAGKNAYYFVHKLNSDLNTTIYATRVGGNVDGDANPSELYPTAFGIDGCENIYFSGAGEGGGFPTTSDAYTTQKKGVYMCKLDRDAQNLVYGSYFGGSDGSHMHPATNCKYNEQGRLFHTECTEAKDYPIENGDASTISGGQAVNDGASFVFDFYFEAILEGLDLGEDIEVCGPPVTLEAGIGVPNVTYEWNTGSNDSTITVEDAGVYTVMVYNLCDTIHDTIEVIFSPGFSIDLGDDQTICTDATTTLSIADAYPTYEWSNGASSATITVGPGTYTLSVTDDLGCLASDTIVINPDSVTVELPDDHQMCEGDSLVISPTTIGDITVYDWSNGENVAEITVFNSGTYTLTVNSAFNCSDSDEITVTVDPMPDATIDPAGPFCISDPAIVLNAVTGGGTWSGPGITDANGGNFDPASANDGVNEIIYTVSNNNCEDIDTLLISVSNQLDATITQVGPFCASDAPVTLSTVDVGGDWTATCNNCVDTDGNFDPSIAGEGSHTITYTIAGDCGDQHSITIEVNSIPAPEIDMAGPFCLSDPATTLTANENGGTWSGVGITDANAGTFDPATAGDGNHEIVYEINNNGCLNSDTITIAVSDQLDATITQVGPFCDNEASVQLEAVDAGGTWTATCGACVDVDGVFDPATAGGGTHTITYNLPGDCGDEQTIDIVVNAVPNPVIDPAGPYCLSDDEVTLTVSEPNGTWTGNGITDNLAGTFDPATAGEAAHEIIYIINNNGCVNSDTITINVNDQLDPTITQVGPFCNNDLALLLEVVDAGGVWSSDCGNCLDADGTFDPSNANLGDNNIYYEHNGSCGSQDQIVIVVNAVPDPTITPVGPFCASDDEITLTAANSGGVWSGDGITNFSLGTFDPSIAVIGNNDINYAIDNDGCIASDNITIVVNDTTDATITDVGPYCADNAAIQLEAVDAGGEWSSANGAVSIGGIFDPSNASIGDNVVFYTINGACGDSDSTIIEVIENAVARPFPAGPYCETEAAVALTSQNGEGEWNGPGVIDPSGVFSPAVAGPGNHWVMNEITGMCGDQDSIEIEVVAVPEITIESNGPHCEDETSTTMVATPIGGVWSATCNSCIDANSGLLNISSADVGDNTIYYEVSGICYNIDSTVVVINGLPEISFYTNDTIGCNPHTATFYNEAVSGSSCEWDFGDGNTALGCDSIDHTYVNDGCFTVGLTVTSPEGCVNSGSKTDYVCVYAVPEAAFSFTPEITDIYDPEYFFTDESTDANQWLWDFAGLDTSIEQHPEYNFEAKGEYKVCLTVENDPAGCIDSTCKTVIVEGDFIMYIPNAFTPDGDGVNDFFYPVFGADLPIDFTFMIFDRWGERIFETESLDQYWDGTRYNIPVQQDVYVWRIRLKEKENAKKREYVGHVTLLR